jgi:schlafen family protein
MSSREQAAAKRAATERALLRTGQGSLPSSGDALDLRGETKHLDYKGPGAWEELKTSLVKHIIAMSNIRDGGRIVVGVQETPDTKVLDPVGLTDAQLASFDTTDVGRYVNNFVRGSVTTHVQKQEIEGKPIVILEVREFERHPNICARQCPKSPPTFHEGQILIRSDNAESRAIRTAEEMQELLRLAMSKTSEALLRDMKRIIEGGAPASVPLDAYAGTIEEWRSEVKNFRAELEQHSETPRGTFDAFLVPVDGTSLAETHEALKDAVDKAVVNRGNFTPFPFAREYDRVRNRSGFIEGTGSTRSYERKWRLYTNGFFAFVENLRENDSTLAKTRGRHIHFERACAKVGLTLIFASRLNERLAYDGPLLVTFRWTDTAGRFLQLDVEDWRALRDYECHDADITLRLPLTTTDLKAGWEPFATVVLKQLAALFQFDNASAAIAEVLVKLRGV